MFLCTEEFVFGKQDSFKNSYKCYVFANTVQMYMLDLNLNDINLMSDFNLNSI